MNEPGALAPRSIKIPHPPALRIFPGDTVKTKSVVGTQVSIVAKIPKTTLAQLKRQ